MKKRNKIFILILGILAALCFGLYVWLFYFGLMERIVNNQLAKFLNAKLTMRTEIGDISGDGWNYLIFSDVNIFYDDGETSYMMAHVPHLKTHYTWRHLWDGKYFFEKIEIDSAVFNLRQDHDKIWLLPKSKNKKSSETRTAFDFQVSELILKNIGLNLIMSEDTISFDNIFFDARIEGQEGTFSAIIDRFSYQASDARFNLVSAGGVVTANHGNIMFQNFLIKTDSSDLKIDGQMILGDNLRTYIGIDAKRININEVASFLKKRLSGNVSVVGILEYQAGRLAGDVTLSGTFQNRLFDSVKTKFSYGEKKFTFDTLMGTIFGGCQIAATGDLDIAAKPPVYNLVGEIKNFNLSDLIFNSYESNFNGKINLSGTGFKKEELVLNVIISLDESWFDQYHAWMAAGEMKITSDSLRFSSDFAIKYQNNFFLVGGLLDYSGKISMTGHTVFNDLSAFNEKIFIKRMGGRADLNFLVTGELKNPDISGQFNSDSLWLYDIYSNRAKIKFRLDRFLNNRQGTVEMSLFDGSMYQLPYDSIKMQMNIDSQMVLINRATLSNDYTDLKLHGSLDYASYPQLLNITALNLELMSLPFTNDSSIVIQIDSSGYNFIRCRLQRPSGYIEGRGFINTDETIDFQVLASNINISPWIKLFSDDYKIDGSASGKLELRGTLKRPQMKLQSDIDSLSFLGLNLGDLTLQLEYADQLIQIKAAELKSDEGNYLMRGTVPLNLSLTHVEKRLLDMEQDIRITAQDKRMDLVSLMLHEVEDFTGNFNADFRLTGTAQKPKINGLIGIKEGRLKVYDLIDPLEDVYVELRMEDKLVYVDSAYAVCHNGKKNTGQISGRGKVVLNAIDQIEYDLQATALNFPARYELGDITATVDADITIKGMTPPTVSGDVKIIRAMYRENFATKEEGWLLLSSFQEKNSWDLNLNIKAVSNLWIKNDAIDAEFSSEILFVRENDIFKYYGALQVLRGKSYWFDRTFRLEAGGEINYDDIEYPNPKLNLFASTKIRGRTPNQFGEMETTSMLLRVLVGGTLDEPIFTAAEGSQYSTEELPSVLLLNYSINDTTGGQTGDVLGGRFTAGISNYLSSQVGRIGARTLGTLGIGVETLEIDPVYGDKFNPLGTTVTAGGYLASNLYLYGRTAMQGQVVREVGFEYRFQRFLMMEGQRDENNLYHLNLNFFYDY